MKVTVLLADSGQSDASGKAHALGIGWTIVDGPTTQPMAVIVLVMFERVQDAKGTHEVTLELLDEHGKTVESPDGGKVTVNAELVVGMAAADLPDAPGSAHLVVSIGPGLPLAPGKRYQWEAMVDGRRELRAHAPFVTRSTPLATTSAVPLGSSPPAATS